MSARHLCVVAALLTVLGVTDRPTRVWADPPKVKDLRTQKVGQTIYFQVRLERPADMQAVDTDEKAGPFVTDDFFLQPRLVPQDSKSKTVYLSARRTERLEFLGKVEAIGPAQFLLLYPKQMDRPKNKQTLADLLQRKQAWVETPLTLDFAKAAKIEAPAAKRKLPMPKDGRVLTDADLRVNDNDLEGQWAQGQLAQFAALDSRTGEFGFYSFASETTSRKYAVADPLNRGGGIFIGRNPFPETRLYEITTGAAAITESLALNRLRDPNFRNKDEARSIDIGKVQGIDIAEHPWVKMMAGQKPSPEPLAKLVPHDNYYVHFKNIVKFLETGDLFDQWGTSLSRALEVNSRDYQVKERLETQLCLKSTKLARLFGPAVVKSLALTGSDPYVREGSDLAIIFHVSNKDLFLAAVEPHIKEARTNFGAKLKEEKQKHLDIAIESFVSPLREVSLYRAIFDDYIVYCNSPIGIRRVLDTYKGKMKALADSLDFQYMRTVFRLEDPLEDGFVFLSDPFIRTLVGPATRIKERRRLEALTSLSMVNNAALFFAWETGKLPAHNNELMQYTGLKAEQLFSPDGDAAFWNADNKMAVSSYYNTQVFATPLIEIPIDHVTPSEQREYEQFRLQYLGLWRQFFDPIGIRIGLSGKDVRWETYILPLVKTTQYNELRRLAGDGTIKLDPGMFRDKTIIQFLSHLSPNARERQEFGKILSGFSREIPGLSWLGNWFTVRLDDSPALRKLLELELMRDLDPARPRTVDEELGLFFQLPLTVGVEIRNPLVFAGVLAAGKRALTDALPGAVEWGPLKEPYKGTTIVQIKATEQAGIGRIAGTKDPLTPSLFYAAFVDGHVDRFTTTALNPAGTNGEMDIGDYYWNYGKNRPD